MVDIPGAKSSPRERLAYLLAARNITRATLASMCGVTRQAVTNWLRREKMSGDNMKLIAARTGVSLDWLADGLGEPFSAVRAENIAPNLREISAQDSYPDIVAMHRELAQLRAAIAAVADSCADLLPDGRTALIERLNILGAESGQQTFVNLLSAHLEQAPTLSNRARKTRLRLVASPAPLSTEAS